MKKNQKFLLLTIFIVGLYVIFLRVTALNTGTISYADFKNKVEAKEVYSIEISQNKAVPTGKVNVQLYGNKVESFNVEDINKIVDYAETQGIKYTILPIQEESWFVDKVLPIMIGAMVLGIIMTMIFAQVLGASSGGNSVNKFGKSRAKVYFPGKNNINFESVAGLSEEKEEVADIVKFLKYPEKYNMAGARIPKGILLVGPPGTGKTLLAKAIAGEAGVAFFSISGSDFVEMFVGVGASRVRDLFEQAKKNAPCIIFIDEIDAVARKRGAGIGGGHDEREQTLNQLLVEMDGFESNTGVIVMAATNRVDILDNSILRAGRFDRKVGVGRPDVAGREAILKVHSKNKALGEDVNLHEVALTTSGFVGADLENLMNEAAILAVDDNRNIIMAKDISAALIKVGIGLEKKSRIVSDEERKITAYHEAGHAILFHVLDGMGPVQLVSIIPTGMGAAGYTMPLPQGDNLFATKSKLKKEIMVSLGGRIAEEIIFGDVTTGASGDLENVTSIARDMVMKYGMSDKLGLINYENSDSNVFVGSEMTHARTYGENIATDIDKEVRSIVDECYAEAKKLILDNIDILHKCSELLLQKDKINQEEFEALFNTKEEV